MLTINDLKNGSSIVILGDPYIVMSVKHLHVGRGSSSVQTRIRNLRTGQVFERNFKPADMFEEADIKKMTACFIYISRGEYWFHEDGKPSNRFMLLENAVGEKAVFLKPKMKVTALLFTEKGDQRVLAIELPIKGDYAVVDAPPPVRGNTAQGGTKVVTIEGGATVDVPLFINTGDVIRVNTDTGEYVERIEKA
ncbi:MAG: elongation factor P [bacterium]